MASPDGRDRGAGRLHRPRAIFLGIGANAKRIGEAMQEPNGMSDEQLELESALRSLSPAAAKIDPVEEPNLQASNGRAGSMVLLI